jgi:hypothetical protein
MLNIASAIRAAARLTNDSNASESSGGPLIVFLRRTVGVSLRLCSHWALVRDIGGLRSLIWERGAAQEIISPRDANEKSKPAVRGDV